MMRARVVVAAGILLVLTPVIGSAESPFEPLKRAWKNEMNEVRRGMKNPGVLGPVKKPATAKAAEPETTTAAKPAETAAKPAAAAPEKAKPAPATTTAVAKPKPPAVKAADTVASEAPMPRMRPEEEPQEPEVFAGATEPEFAEELSAVQDLRAVSPKEAAVLPPKPLAYADQGTVDQMRGTASAAAAAAAAPVVLPHPRPQVAALAPAAGTAPATDAPAPKPPVAAIPPATPEEVAACASDLSALGIKASPLASISEGACGVSAPTAVASLENGAVTFTTKAIVNCAVAGAISKWLEDDVQPAAKRVLDGRVTSIRVAASYSCRGRNNDPKAQLSEHSFGNAIDISAIKVDDTWVEVGNTKDEEQAAFLAEIRNEACGPFTTVLGPGVAYHDTHFHLDLAKRGKRGNSLYCR